MNQTLNEFKTQQDKNKELLGKLLHFVNEGINLGVDIDKAFVQKLENSIQDLSNEKLKVALIGGFSEGKTSIAAAWVEKLDKTNMKIDHQESSDAVQIFNIDDEIELIDTPGLFGFKQKENEERKVEKYKDITKKYVSEAHLVLYVLNSSNPIKESHKEDLEWLFKTLNLLPRTVFVLSRFDEIADIEDEVDYQKQFEVKKANVAQRLQELLKLSEAERENLAIVAVSANPFDEGVEYWLEHKEEFKKLSRIGLLQEKTKEKIAQNGGKLAIVEEAKKSIIQDILHNQLPVAKETNDLIAEETSKLKKAIDHMQKHLLELNQEVSKACMNLREFTTRFFSDLIVQLQGTSLETFNEFMAREVGDKGINIDTRIQNEFERQTSRIYGDITRATTDFTSEVSFFEKSMMSLGKQGLSYLSKNNVINNTAILATRDALVSGAKMVGFDLGLKFKPWGAVNLAGKLNIALAVFGVALELWDSYKQQEREKKFLEAKEEMTDNFNQQKEEILNLLKDDKEFKEKFFPNAIQLEMAIEQMRSALAEEEKRKQEFNAWLKEGEIIEAEFSVEKNA